MDSSDQIMTSDWTGIGFSTWRGHYKRWKEEIWYYKSNSGAPEAMTWKILAEKSCS